MPQRVFIGVKISHELQSLLLKWIGKQEYKLPIRWLQIESLHMTLIPPWDEVDVSKTLKCLSQIQEMVAPFTISFTHLSYGPDIFKPRLVWLTGRPNPSLIKLYQQLQKLFNSNHEHRQFIPHVTIGRFSLSRLSPFPETTIDEKVLWQESVSAVSLFASHRGVKEAHYEVLGDVSLKKSDN